MKKEKRKLLILILIAMFLLFLKENFIIQINIIRFLII